MLNSRKKFKPSFFDLRHTVKLNIGITADDLKKLKADAKEAGQTIPDYIRLKLNIPTVGELAARRAERLKEYKKRNPFF